MTWQFTPNVAGTSTSDNTGLALRALWDLMLLHGTHEIVGSSDGVATFANEGDTAGPYDFTTIGATWGTGNAGEWSNTEAWLRLREVGTTREWIFWRYLSVASYSNRITIAFSPTGFVSTGTADANTPPDAPLDMVLIHGTAYAGTAGAWGPSQGVACTMHVAVNDAQGAVGAGGTHAFYLFGVNTATKSAQGFWFVDSLVDGIAGDTQAWATLTTGVPTTAPVDSVLDGKVGTYRDFGGANEAWLDGRSGGGASPAIVEADGTVLFPGGCPTQDDGNARTGEIHLARAQDGIYRGKLENVVWKDTTARVYPTTAHLATADAKVYVGDLLLPWPQGVAPI